MIVGSVVPVTYGRVLTGRQGTLIGALFILALPMAEGGESFGSYLSPGRTWRWGQRKI